MHVQITIKILAKQALIELAFTSNLASSLTTMILAPDSSPALTFLVHFFGS